MAENRIRLGPFALKLIAKHAPKGTAPDGKALDDLLIKAFSDGRAFDLGLAGEISDVLSQVPDLAASKEVLLSEMLGALDGHGDESLESFAKLNKRVDGLGEALMKVERNTRTLGQKVADLTEQIKALRQECKTRDPF